jgi:anti-anti-sigma factor
MSEPDFVIDRSEPGRLKLVGELDIQSSKKLHLSLADLDGAAIDVDLSGVTFMDSSGLRSIVVLREKHKGVRYVQPSTHVARLLEITGLTFLLYEPEPEPEPEPDQT